MRKQEVVDICYKNILVNIRETLEQMKGEEGLNIYEINKIVEEEFNNEIKKLRVNAIDKDFDNETHSRALAYSSPMSVKKQENLNRVVNYFFDDLSDFLKSFFKTSTIMLKKYPENIIIRQIYNSQEPDEGVCNDMGSTVDIGEPIFELMFGNKEGNLDYRLLSDLDLLYINFDINKMSSKNKDLMYTFLLAKEEAVTTPKRTCAYGKDEEMFFDPNKINEKSVEGRVLKKCDYWIARLEKQDQRS